MKILITGANGYIGSHVVNEALNNGHEVIVADLRFNNVDNRAKRCNENIFNGDKNIYEKTGSVDVLIHLAWQDGFVHNSKAHMGNLSKHYEFLTNMIDGGLPLLSVMGTMHEVGYHEGVIDENTPCNPMSQYGIAKNALRQSILAAAKDTQCKVHWLRAYYITGDDLKANSIFAKINKAAQEGKKEFPFTTGKNKYDFIDVNDLAKMIVKASVQDKINGIINVCSGKPVSLAERVELFIKENNFDIKLQYGVFPDRAYDSPMVYGDAEKINKILEGI